MNGMQPYMLIVLSEHVQPLPLIQVSPPLMLPASINRKGVVVVVVVIVVVRLSVPERSLRVIQPGRREAVERVIP